MIPYTSRQLPGKKGIALSPEQWRTLLANADAVSAALAKVEPKPAAGAAAAAPPEEEDEDADE